MKETIFLFFEFIPHQKSKLKLSIIVKVVVFFKAKCTRESFSGQLAIAYCPSNRIVDC
jgi:hypothetical protein